MNDQDPGLFALLDRLTPHTEAPPDWADALRRASAQTPTRRPSTRRTAGAAVAVMAVLAVLLVSSWHGQRSIVDRANAALALRPQTILHERFASTNTDLASGKVTHASLELWLGSGGRFRAIRSTTGGALEEFGRAGSNQTLVSFDRNTNTLKSNCIVSGYHFRDPVAVIRHYLAAGKMKVVDPALLSGRPVVKLRGVSPGETDELYVDRSTYYPVQLTTHFFRGGQNQLAVIRFTTYSYRPASPATRALTDIRSQHPHAKLVGC